MTSFIDYPNVCVLCFELIKPGEHYVDEFGQFWNVHPECEERDKRPVPERKPNRG
jgi:hypothetical protein